jgi:hypothetical protein
MARAQVEERPVEIARQTLSRRVGARTPRPRAGGDDQPLTEVLRRARLAVEGVQKELADLRRRVLQLEAEDEDRNDPAEGGGEPAGDSDARDDNEPILLSRKMAALTHNGNHVNGESPAGEHD